MNEIDVAGRSSLAGAIALLQPNGQGQTAGAVFAAAPDGRHVEAGLVAMKLGEALGYDVMPTALDAPARWNEGEGDTLVLALAGGAKDAATVAALARATLANPQRTLLVISTEPLASHDDDPLLEALCDAVTDMSRAGSGRDGGVEVVVL